MHIGLLLGSGTYAPHLRQASSHLHVQSMISGSRPWGIPDLRLNSESCVTFDSQVYYRLMYSQGCLMALE